MREARIEETKQAGCRPATAGSFPIPKRKVERVADETVAKHGASVARTTVRDREAYGDPLPVEAQIPSPAPFRAQIVSD